MYRNIVRLFRSRYPTQLPDVWREKNVCRMMQQRRCTDASVRRRLCWRVTGTLEQVSYSNTCPSVQSM